MIYSNKIYIVILMIIVFILGLFAGKANSDRVNEEKINNIVNNLQDSTKNDLDPFSIISKNDSSLVLRNDKTGKQYIITFDRNYPEVNELN